MKTRLSTIVKWFVTVLVASSFAILSIFVILIGISQLNGFLTLVGFLIIALSWPITIMAYECIPDDLSLPRFSISRMGIHRIRESNQEPSTSIIYSGGRGNLTINSADSLFSTGDYAIGAAVANSQFGTDAYPPPLISWPPPSDISRQESRRRQRQARSPMDILLEAAEEAQRAERNASGRRRSLQFIPDREYVALGQALHAEFNGRRRLIYEISESDQSEQHRLNRIRWAEHRRENPECDCHRCQVYRGEVGEETEDPLGW